MDAINIHSWPHPAVQDSIACCQHSETNSTKSLSMNALVMVLRERAMVGVRSVTHFQ